MVICEGKSERFELYRMMFREFEILDGICYGVLLLSLEGSTVRICTMASLSFVQSLGFICCG